MKEKDEEKSRESDTAADIDERTEKKERGAKGGGGGGGIEASGSDKKY